MGLDETFRRQERNSDNLQILLNRYRAGFLSPRQIYYAARLGCEDSTLLAQQALGFKTIKQYHWDYPDLPTTIQGGLRRQHPLSRYQAIYDVCTLYREWRRAFVYYATNLLDFYSQAFNEVAPELCQILTQNTAYYRHCADSFSPFAGRPDPNPTLMNWPPTPDFIFTDSGFALLPDSQQELIRRFSEVHELFNNCALMGRGYGEMMSALTVQQSSTQTVNNELIRGVSVLAHSLLVKVALGEVPPFDNFELMQSPSISKYLED